MSNFPTSLDDDITLPYINDNITEIGGDAINALRDAVFAVEQNIGLGVQGSLSSLQARLDVFILPDGTPRSSVLTSLGLVTLPITNTQISASAQIAESKLDLDHSTQQLYNLIDSFSDSVNTAISWISATGSKIAPHIAGSLYKHTLSHISVNSDPANYFKNKFDTLRDNTNSFTALDDLNDELITHQLADGSPFTTPVNITTYNSSTYPSNYGHTSSGIYLNTSRFTTIPQTALDLQQFAEFIDSSNMFLYGTRIQNLYSNGISKISRSSTLSVDGYGAPLIPNTPAIAYLYNVGLNSSPFDDIDAGDDIVEFKPASADMTSHSFDAKFALVKVGDIIRVNYGTIEIPFLIKEKKYIQSGGSKKYLVRILGKNYAYSATATARIDKSLVNGNKFGVLAVGAANNNFSETPSLIVGSPKGAQALGLGFNAAQFNETHYQLYLAVYPTGSPADGYTILPPIDVTGDRGASPGKYTLESVVEATNNAFRQPGYNYRFLAFSYNGEFGIMIADSYSNTGFSILSAAVADDGTYDELATNVAFQNNVVGVFATSPAIALDPIGFGSSGSNVASPPFMTTYGSAEASQIPTKLYLPLKRNNFYTNGIERDKMTLDVGQILDGYGDGYWVATVKTQTVFPGIFPTGRVETTYTIPLNLENSNLKEGKTIVVKSANLIDSGRFIIKSINASCAPSVFTELTVYDAVHATGSSPDTTLAIDSTVSIYFNSDSVSFNQESATDTVSVTPFKRHFEVLIDENGSTFTHERARINASRSTLTINGAVSLYTYSELNKLDIVKVSPKLRGYQFGNVTKISLNMISYDETSGVYDGYLCYYDGLNATKIGSDTTGYKGQVTRFYDETNSDYIEVIFDSNVAVSSFGNKVLDFQLFPTLSLDDEVMLIGTCQLNDVTNTVNTVRDERQFGNVSEKEFSTSALNFLSVSERYLHSNGIVRGGDLSDTGLDNPSDGQISLKGCLAVVNGKFIQMNNSLINIPVIKESYLTTLKNINWILCINDKSEYQTIPLLDYDTTLGTPSNSSRNFKAFNLVDGTTYYLDATTFSNLINNRKDLTPLYVVAATTAPGSGLTPPTIALVLTDVRKYVNDVDNNLPLRLTTGNSQGNFKNVQSIFNWIKYNNTFNSQAFIKGASVSNGGVLTEAFNFDFQNSVIIDGENNALLTTSALATIGSNITFKNLNIDFSGGIYCSTLTNVIFDNCTISITVPTTPPSENIIFDIFAGSNILIKDCAITVTYQTQYPDTNVYRGAVIRVTDTTDFQFINSTLNVTYPVVTGSITPGDIFNINTSNRVIIRDSDFSGNFNKFVSNRASNDLLLQNLTVTSTYSPLDGALVDTNNEILYSATNLVNSGQGYVYSDVASTLDNMTIDNVKFTYTATNILSKNRYSFINLELTTNTAILSNLKITNCKFINTNVTGLYDDVRPAISIINTAAANTSFSQQPIVINANISNNYCNRNQTIILTSATSSTRMVYPGLASIGTVIKDNICGAIGYWVAAGSKTVNTVPNANSLSDKISGLTIEGNTCHYIAALNSTGHVFQVATWNGVDDPVNYCDYPSGYVSIKNNKTSWIHTGISFEDSAALKISDNYLTAYDHLFIEQFGDVTSDTIGSGYAIFVTSNRYLADVNLTALGEDSSNNSSCIITNNTVNTGYWLQTTLSTSVYEYLYGYIFCMSSNIISNNILKGIATTTLPAILVTGKDNQITNNKIYRGSNNILSYVSFERSTPMWNGVGSTGIITDNYFDSPYTNSTTLDENTIIILTTGINGWTYERNKNQTGYAAIPLSNAATRTSYSLGALDYNSADIYVVSRDATAQPATGGARSQNVLINDATASATEYKITIQENIEKYLPNNVRIISATAGLRGYGGQLTTDPMDVSSKFFMNISSLDPTIDYSSTAHYSGWVSDDTSIKEFTVPVYATITGSQINSISTNIPYSINLESYNSSDISYNYKTGRGLGITLSVDWRWKRASTFVQLTHTPIKVKYRW